MKPSSPCPFSQPATVLPECIRALVWQVGGRRGARAQNEVPCSLSIDEMGDGWGEGDQHVLISSHAVL
jgi:hypothetical protein